MELAYKRGKEFNLLNTNSKYTTYETICSKFKK